MPEKVLVTGGAGFIGSHIAEECLKQGFEVKIIDNMLEGKMENINHFLNDIEFVKGDITDKEFLLKELNDVDFISHQAGLRSPFHSVEIPHEYNRVNIDGTLNLLEAAKENNVKRLVFASSSSVYGNPDRFPADETFLPDPKSPYALTKMAGEFYLKYFHETFGLETVSLRYFNAFGERQDPKNKYACVIPKFLEKMLFNAPPLIYGDGRQVRDFVYVKDLANANLAAFKSGKQSAGKAFNIASGEIYSLLDLVEKINALLGTSFEPEFFEVRDGDVKKTEASLDQARSLLGFQPQYSFDQALKNTVEWFKENKDWVFK
jgi:nucleoside-diphosphate-sugar epimerase